MGENRPEPEGMVSRFPAYLGAVAALIAAMMPLSAFINGWYSVKVEREKFLTQMRLDYLDRALDTSRDSAYREGVIRFLLETVEPSDPLYKWAYNQITIAEEIHKLEERIAELDVGLRKTGNALAAEQGERSRDRSVASAREKDLLEQIAKESKERARLKQDLHSAEMRAGRTTTVGQDVELQSDILPGILSVKEGEQINLACKTLSGNLLYLRIRIGATIIEGLANQPEVNFPFKPQPKGTHILSWSWSISSGGVIRCELSVNDVVRVRHTSMVSVNNEVVVLQVQ